MVQIQYGCVNEFCDTPTCLSRNKRMTHKPFRPPTELTARILAFHLVSEDDPYSHLCPNQPVPPPPDDKPFDDVPGSSYPEFLLGRMHRLQVPRKDVKSLSQAVVDTVSSIFSWAMTLSTPGDIFNALRAKGGVCPAVNDNKSKDDSNNGSDNTLREQSVKKAHDEINQPPESVGTSQNGAASTSRVNGSMNGATGNPKSGMLPPVRSDE